MTAALTLRQKQSLFVRLVAEWVAQVYELGYELTFGDAARLDRRGHARHSLHYDRLALDVNLFVRGDYITDGQHEAWARIGALWEQLNPLCRWGGRWGDANHLSLTHRGMS